MQTAKITKTIECWSCPVPSHTHLRRIPAERCIQAHEKHLRGVMRDAATIARKREMYHQWKVLGWPQRQIAEYHKLSVTRVHTILHLYDKELNASGHLVGLDHRL